jgi:hypothetical protein
MRGLSRSIGAIAVAGAVVGGCASSPKKIDAAYVSPLKYQSFTCDQLAIERTAIEHRANRLHRSLKRRATGDAAKMTAGAVIFLPTLLFLKGNGTKAAEYAQLKGDYQALRLSAEDRGCELQFPEFNKVAAASTTSAELVVDSN